MGERIKLEVQEEGKYGKSNISDSFVGRFFYKTLIELFVKLHYPRYGRPDWKTWTDIKAEARLYEVEHPKEASTEIKRAGQEED